MQSAWEWTPAFAGVSGQDGSCHQHPLPLAGRAFRHDLARGLPRASHSAERVGGNVTDWISKTGTCRFTPPGRADACPPSPSRGGWSTDIERRAPAFAGNSTKSLRNPCAGRGAARSGCRARGNGLLPSQEFQDKTVRATSTPSPSRGGLSAMILRGACPGQVIRRKGWGESNRDLYRLRAWDIPSPHPAALMRVHPPRQGEGIGADLHRNDGTGGGGGLVADQVRGGLAVERDGTGESVGGRLSVGAGRLALTGPHQPRVRNVGRG